MLNGLIKRIAQIDQALRTHTANYANTREFFGVRDNTAKVEVPFDINDILLMGALTNSDVLLSGATGAGKTHLSRMAMTGLYGAGNFTNLTVTPGLNEGDFIDIDIVALKQGKKSLRQAIERTPLLTQPGAIINEINRTPEILQNAFISYLERIFSLKGSEFPVGVPLGDGDSPQDPHYQFRSITINEGADYLGTSGIDKAVRDRVVIEIPMDYFRPRNEDNRRMVRNRKDAGLSVERFNGGKLEDVLAVVKDVEKIPVSQSAEEFITYLLGLDNCVRSSTHSKRGINFNLKMCEGCHFSKDKVSPNGNICGSVYAPSNRSIINLKKIGRITAALRAYKVIDAISHGDLDVKKDPKEVVSTYLANLKVTLEDIAVVAPLILTTKMVIDPRWVAQHFQGSKYLATEHIVKTAVEKFKNYVGSGAYEVLIKSKGEMTDAVKSTLREYVTDTDPWVYNLADLESDGCQGSLVGQRKVELDALLD